MSADYGAVSGEGPTPGGEDSPAARLPSLDVLRGVAVLGILLINISIFALPPGAYTVPGGTDFGALLDFQVWVFNELFVEGTMRGLFSILFGASLVLMTGALSTAPPAPLTLDHYARRSLWLIVFGLAHAYLLLWPYDILYAYGLLGLLLLPLRGLSARTLFLAGLVMLGITALISGLKPPAPEGEPGFSFYNLSVEKDSRDTAGLPEGFSDVTPSGEDIRMDTARARAQDAIDTRRSGYADNFFDMAEETARLHTKSFYGINVFDIGGMMLIGMALLKAGILTGRRSRRFYVVMLAAGYGIGVVVNGVETWTSVTAPDDTAKLIYWSEVTYDLGRLPMVIGHVATLILLMNRRFFDPVARLLSAAGRLALTNYVMQTVICNMLFLGVGFGLYGAISLHRLMIICMLIWIVQITFSMTWLHRFRMGPLEWALRSLVRWAPQPLRRRARTGLPAAQEVAGR